MSRFERKLTRAQQKQVARTKQGRCSRCNLPRAAHTPLPDLKCPDGGGSFTWALDRAGMDQAIERIETMQSQMMVQRAKRLELSSDARIVLDRLVDLSGAEVTEAVLSAVMVGAFEQGRGRPVTSRELAAALGWTVERVRLATIELREAGCIDSGPPEVLQ